MFYVIVLLFAIGSVLDLAYLVQLYSDHYIYW